MPRRKPKSVLIIEDLDQAEKHLGELASLERDLENIKTKLNDSIDQLKAKAAAEAKPLADRCKELETGLATFAATNKTKLFKRPRSRKLAFGTIGFRKSTELKPMPKMTWKAVLAKLISLKFTDAIRNKKSVNREELEKWTDERLEQVGVERKKKDEFFIEIRAEKVGK